MEIEFRQANAEFQLIDWLHESRKRAAGIVINPAALTHTSVAVLDALNTCEFPILEVHITNIHKREEFLHHSFVSRVAAGVICGFGTQGYFLAIQHLARLIGSPRTATVQTEGAFLVGLIGAGIQASLTPAMHEREGAAQGLRYIYRLIDLATLGLGVEALAELITAAGRMGFAGLNITHPCKQSVIPLLDDLSDDARSLGAVNTVVFKDGKRVGHNTDWFGFAENFRRGLPDARRDHVVQLGAGGAGSAVAHAVRRQEVDHRRYGSRACQGSSRRRRGAFWPGSCIRRQPRRHRRGLGDRGRVDKHAGGPAVGSQRRTRVRFGILALISVGTMINYLDRTVLGIATPSLTKELALDPVVMGLVFSAFALTYAAAQLPGGVFLNRFGARLTWDRLGARFITVVPATQLPVHGTMNESVIAVGDIGTRMKDWFAEQPGSIVFLRPDRSVAALTFPQEVSETTDAFAQALSAQREAAGKTRLLTAASPDPSDQAAQ